MTVNQQHFDYEPVAPSRRARAREGWGGEADAEEIAAAGPRAESSADAATRDTELDARGTGSRSTESAAGFSPFSARAGGRAGGLRRAHALTYAGLFLFTAVLFFRPYEFLPLPKNLAYWFAVLTLAVFLPSQLAAERTLTARPREVNLVLLLCGAALLSIPLAKGSRLEAWNTFSDVFIRAMLVFVVIINAVRTERRLKGLMLLSLGSGCVLAAGALNNYRLGNLTVEGYRVEGVIGGMFENPNDMALHLVTMLPFAVALLFGSRGVLRKLFFGACAALMMAGMVVTFSRGGFLAMVAAFLTLAWTLGRRNRAAVVALACVTLVAFLLLAPGNYAGRIFSIFDRSYDAFGSADARQALLQRSILVALRNPLFGVGMGNFQFVSFRNQVTHNTYTQVAAEMGMVALVIYTMFVLTPLRHLRRIVRETFDARRSSRFHY
ncbi:MAG: O-antigen ligase family protein, partial [Acidobacteria bacterium]|nr:O-antigen ligase family protein [Acidobacteriota bacterium]